jgi:hypothetical protein
LEDGRAGAFGSEPDGVAIQLFLDVEAEDFLVRNATLGWVASGIRPR